MGEFVKVAGQNKQQRYTSYACIFVYMHIAKTLPESIILAHEDTEWTQPLEYEHIPFRCRKCHEHGHLYQDCPKNKTPIVLTIATDEDGFKKVTKKRKQRRKNPSVSKFSNPSTRNIFGVLES